MKDKFFSTEKLWYFNMFLWLRTLRFWQSGWVYSDWRGFISTQCSSIIKTKMFSKRTTFAWFVPKDIYIAFLTTPSETFSKQSSRSFTCCLELMKSFYFKLIYLCSKFSSGHAEGSFGITAETFWRKTNFFLHSSNRKSIYIVSIRFFSFKVFLWTSWKQVWQPVLTSCDKSLRFFHHIAEEPKYLVFSRKVFSLNPFQSTRRMQ